MNKFMTLSLAGMLLVAPLAQAVEGSPDAAQKPAVSEEQSGQPAGQAAPQDQNMMGKTQLTDEQIKRIKEMMQKRQEAFKDSQMNLDAKKDTSSH